MAAITESDRIRRAIKIMREYHKGRKELLNKLEGINIRQIVKLRNYECLTLADVEQQIRKTEGDLEYTRLKETITSNPRIMAGGYKE